MPLSRFCVHNGFVNRDPDLRSGSTPPTPPSVLTGDIHRGGVGPILLLNVPAAVVVPRPRPGERGRVRFAVPEKEKPLMAPGCEGFSGGVEGGEGLVNLAFVESAEGLAHGRVDVGMPLLHPRDHLVEGCDQRDQAFV